MKAMRARSDRRSSFQALRYVGRLRCVWVSPHTPLSGAGHEGGTARRPAQVLSEVSILGEQAHVGTNGDYGVVKRDENILHEHPGAERGVGDEGAPQVRRLPRSALGLDPLAAAVGTAKTSLGSPPLLE
jgi:hypothetical protein